MTRRAPLVITPRALHIRGGTGKVVFGLQVAAGPVGTVGRDVVLQLTEVERERLMDLLSRGKAS
jgi:hypothetical protein